MAERRPALLLVVAVALAPGLAAAQTSGAMAPSPATSAPSVHLTTASTAASLPATGALSGTVPLTTLSWGAAFAEYMRLLRDRSATPEQLEIARTRFEALLEPATTATVPVTGPATPPK